jgi:membrane protein required for colicin V production
MNPFDAAIYVIALIAMVTGFNAGLLRGLATILAYAIAAPLALAAAPTVTNWLTAQGLLPIDNMPNAASFVPFGLLLVIGIVLGALMRGAVSASSGGRIGFLDRVLGALLGIARVVLLAVLLVLIFEQIIPRDREPDWLAQSQLRPYLAAAGAEGLRALPPQALDYIGRLKRERGI